MVQEATTVEVEALVTWQANLLVASSQTRNQAINNNNNNRAISRADMEARQVEDMEEAAAA
jgi:hypothetical protein